MEPQQLSHTSPVYSLALLGGLSALAAGGAALLGLRLFFGMSGGDPWPLSLAASAAAALIGPLFWWLFLLRPRRLTLLRGFAAGSLGGVVAHPLTWFLLYLWEYLTSIDLGGSRSATSFLDVVVSPTLAYFSLLFLGWLTVPIGGALGLGFTWAYRFRARSQCTCSGKQG